MKSILMSIKPEWVAKILNGEKTIEIRKRFPKDYVGWVYIYCTKEKKYANLVNRGSLLTGKVVARFWCNKVEEIENLGSQNIFITDSLDCVELLKKSCLYKEELDKYLIKEYEDTKGYAIHISKLEIFDTPKKLNKFYYKRCNFDICYKCYGYTVCNNGWKIHLTKAPQSWRYIERN